MKSHFMRSLAVAILAIPLLIASCSKKDKGNGTDPGAAPVLTAPQFSQAVIFVGSDASSQSAKAKVQEQIAMVAPFLATPLAFATAANTGQWGTKVESCWSKASTQGTCVTTYDVCDASAGSYEWTRTLNGNCSGTAHNQWVGVDAVVTGDGGNGTLSLFKDNTTVLDSLWKWTTAADKNSKELNVYKGAESEANRVAKLRWTKGTGASANNWTFERAATSAAMAAGVGVGDPVKWELHVSADTKTGSADIYGWSAAASPGVYWVQHHIEWEPDSTGTWVEYNSSGTVVHETTWPRELPTIQEPVIGHDIVINSNDPTAQSAQSIVQSQIDLARAFTAGGTGFLGALDSIGWGEQVNGCWTSGGTASGCTVEWKLCEEAQGFRWTYMFDGSCSGQTYDHWIAYEATSSTDGTSGTFLYYNFNSTTIMFSWAWSTSADGKSGTWSYYNGPIAEANLAEQISWVENTDGSTDVTFEIFGSGRMKWVTHESADGTSGYMRMSMWDDTSSAYWLESEIIWNANGTGSWTTYNQDGTIADQQLWS